MRLIVMLTLAARLVWAGGTVIGRTVTVCSQPAAHGLTMYQAQVQASGIFARAGVKIGWRGIRACPTGAIQVNLLDDAPESSHPGALAYSLPYEGTQIVVFYDRIRRESTVDTSTLANVLASVLVHEITHLLQGLSTHSETGVMKARWDERDLGQMRLRPLALAPEDIDRIQRRLDVRSRKAAPVAGSSSSAAAE